MANAFRQAATEALILSTPGYGAAHALSRHLTSHVDNKSDDD